MSKYTRPRVDVSELRLVRRHGVDVGLDTLVPQTLVYRSLVCSFVQIDLGRLNLPTR